MEQGSVADSGLVETLEKIQSVIDQYGWCVVGHPAGSVEISYTLGLSTKGLPELMVYGLDNAAGRHMLNMVAQAVVEDGMELAHLKKDDSLLQYNKLAFLSLDESDAARALMLVNWSSYTQTPVCGMFQVVWSDENGQFPWDDESFAALQPFHLSSRTLN